MMRGGNIEDMMNNPELMNLYVFGFFLNNIIIYLNFFIFIIGRVNLLLIKEMLVAVILVIMKLTEEHNRNSNICI
jgi:hypothetical protein